MSKQLSFESSTSRLLWRKGASIGKVLLILVLVVVGVGILILGICAVGQMRS